MRPAPGTVRLTPRLSTGDNEANIQSLGDSTWIK